MLKFPVSQAKTDDLLNRMKKLGIHEEQLDEKFIRGSGSGGQKINKTSSTVYLKHLPSGIEIKCQESRSLSLNRFIARRMLCEQLETILEGKESAQAKAISKLRRQKARRARKTKLKMLDDKRHKSTVKQGRKKISD